MPGPDGEATVELTVTKRGLVQIPRRFGGLWREIKHVALLRRGKDEAIWFYPVKEKEKKKEKKKKAGE